MLRCALHQPARPSLPDFSSVRTGDASSLSQWEAQRIQRMLPQVVDEGYAFACGRRATTTVSNLGELNRHKQ